jgi:glutamate-1-semialdehyde 2,1-aminomutase
MESRGQKLYRKGKGRIPGGTQLLSKRPEMFLPEHWPNYYSKAKGVEVWDLDEKKYVDMSYCGIGACILGFADDEVDNAVRSAIDAGTMTTLNCPEEVELAEVLCELHPWAEMVRYARCGGEAMAIAVRIARAKTGREKVAFCGYHGWHDWYLAANLGDEKALDGHLLPGLDPAGVPRALVGTALPFRYNRFEELKAIVSSHGQELAAIVMEPVRSQHPEMGFLQRVKEISVDTGAVLIFDEVTSGWRMNTGGIHLTYGIEPDIAVFAKAISNGYPMAAVIGTSEVMQAAQKTFISSTYWTERIGPVAALATIAKHRKYNVADHLVVVGRNIQEGWRSAADDAGLSIEISGIAPLAHFTFRHKDAQAINTLFTQMMLERGFLAKNAFYATYAHGPFHIESYLNAVREVFGIIAEVIARNEVDKALKGPVAHAGFQRLA